VVFGGGKSDSADLSGARAGVLAAAVVVVAAAAVTAVSGCSGSNTPPAGNQSQRSVITSTTLIAGAGVLGNQRRPDESCAADPLPVDPGPPMRVVPHADGGKVDANVHADPQRIVVLSGDQLDMLCALGLQSRIVAAALPDGTTSQPSYLGTTIHNLPAVGHRSAPDVAAIQAAKPDLILGSRALTPDAYPALSAIAPTVFTGTPGSAWQDDLRMVGTATGRADGAAGLIDGFKADAAKTGTDADAGHYQASVVQLTDNTVRVYGADNFAASVLSAVGLDRPAAQRFTDKPFVEIGASDTELAHPSAFSPADADIVYVSFASQAAKDRAPKVLDSPAWRKLSATRDNRVFIVNNEVWQTGEGIVAARGMLADLRWVNAPIN
jgi:iron complex transport system substrate-binding protein